MRAGLFMHVTSLEARKLMSYRADFWVQAVVGFVAQFGVAYFLWGAIFRESGESVIRGYTFDGMVLYYVLVILFGKIVRSAEFMGDIAQDIYDGGLSRYLVYPTSYFRFKYAQHLGQLLPGFAQLFIFGFVYLLFLPWPSEVHLTPASIGMTLVSLAAANLLFFVLHMPVQAVAFWADNVWSLVVMLRFTSNLLGGALLPLALFPDWSQRVLAFLPFRYLYDFPVNTLLGRVTVEEWGLGLLVAAAWTVIIALITAVVWRRGMLSYTGVGI